MRGCKFRFAYGLGVLILASSIVITGCSRTVVNEGMEEKVKPVQVMELKEEKRAAVFSYIGTLDSQTLKRYSFKMPGKISRILVNKGDRIVKGQKLAELDPKELSYALRASELTLTKAQKAYEDAQSLNDKLVQLLEAGAVPQREADQAKLNLELKKADYEQAKIDYESKQSTFNDASLYADFNGYVVDILSKEGEISGAGYPLILIRGVEQVVKVGLTQADARRVKLGNSAEVRVGKIETKGKVGQINAIPDKATRTYSTEIQLANELPPESIYLGSTVNVKIQAGEDLGIWIPILSIQNDGEDYVYVVEQGRAVRKPVILEETDGFEIRVKGLNPKEKLVIAGMKELRQGVKVEITPQAGNPAVQTEAE